jgi:type I restriction enzyme M protein
VFVRKPADDEVLPDDYQVFMGISRRIGQDSEGVPIFKRDAFNKEIEEVDHDLNEMLNDFRSFTAGSLNSSEYRFTIRKSDIDSGLRINPQVYLPNLNETIRRIEQVDARPGWSVSTIGQLVAGVRVFKGPRLKSENLIDDYGASVEPYYTPSAVLQEKSDSAKLLDLSRASVSQLATIDAIRVHRGDIVISRSGTIGRVAYITARLDGAIVSDDLIRVRIPDERVRLYALQFLESEYALNQMLRNEYGAVQQHLEPNHVQNILVPVPDDWSAVTDVIEAVRVRVMQKEALEQAASHATARATQLYETLVSDSTSVERAASSQAERSFEAAT